MTEWQVDAVYRAVGYRSSPVIDIPFDERNAVVPNDGGRVLDLDGDPIPGLYVTGWIKRGPVGLIGHTKRDAAETITHLLAETKPAASSDDKDLHEHLTQRGVPFTTFAGWQAVDAHEMKLGASVGRPRIKVVERNEMLRVSRGH
jgi:ferredoxin--NADP+ reductase